MRRSTNRVALLVVTLVATLLASLFVLPGSSASAEEAHHVQPLSVAKPLAQDSPFYGYGPDDLTSLYGLPANRSAMGAGETVAVVDYGHYAGVLDDLTTYRSKYNLPALTPGQFTEIGMDATGNVAPAASVRAAPSAWIREIMLDVDMVSAVCPACNILLVDAYGTDSSYLSQAVQRAVTYNNHQANYVSLSVGASEWNGMQADSGTAFDDENTIYVAASGDCGFHTSTDTGCDSDATSDPEWPAVMPNVVAAGGITASQDGSSWDVTAWNGAGSGCSQYAPAPDFQLDIDGLPDVCSMRATSDVAAVADVNTGVSIYYSGSWWIAGGTSAAAPQIAAMYALAGNHDDPFTIYDSADNPSDFTDVTSGTTLGCPLDGSSGMLCHAGVGWDGPTGIGYPVGVAGFATDDEVLGHYFVRNGQARVVGKTRVGRVVTAHLAPIHQDSANGLDITNTAATSLQWLRDGKPIKGATDSTYKLTKRDAGSRISFTATVTSATYTTPAGNEALTYTSKSTKPVKP